jgi:hypothetical protein
MQALSRHIFLYVSGREGQAEPLHIGSSPPRSRLGEQGGGKRSIEGAAKCTVIQRIAHVRNHTHCSRLGKYKRKQINYQSKV